MDSLEFLKNAELAKGVTRQIDPLSPQKIRFWLSKFECVTNRPRDVIETDGTLNWLPFIREKYTEVRRRLFGLLKSDQNTVINGFDDEVAFAHRSKEEAGAFVWTNAPDPSLAQLLNSRGWSTDKLHMLGPQFGILKGCSFSAVRQSLPLMMQSSQKEELLERIASIEKAIAFIEERYPKYDELLKQNSEFISPHLRARIHAVAKLVELNKINPFKNGAKAIAEMGKKNIKLPNPRMFMYQREHQIGETGFYAAFEVMQRSLFLCPDIESGPLEEMRVILHELVHADQDASLRQKVSEDDYMNTRFPTPTKKGYCFLADECEAWALELEGLNASLNGALQSHPIDVEKVAKRLKVAPDTLIGKMQIAENYFADGRWQESGAFPRNIAYTICRSYKVPFLTSDGKGWKDVQCFEDVLGTTQFTSGGMPVVIN